MKTKKYNFLETCSQNLSTFQTIYSSIIYPKLDRSNLILLKYNKYSRQNCRFKIHKSHKEYTNFFLRSLNKSQKIFYKNEINNFILRIKNYINKIEAYGSFLQNNHKNEKQPTLNNATKAVSQFLYSNESIKYTDKKALQIITEVLKITSPSVIPLKRKLYSQISSANFYYKNAIDWGRIAMGCRLRFIVYKVLSEYTYDAIIHNNKLYHPLTYLLNHTNMSNIQKITLYPTPSYRSAKSIKDRCDYKFHYPFLIAGDYRQLNLDNCLNSKLIYNRLKKLKLKSLSFSNDSKWKKIEKNHYLLKRTFKPNHHQLLMGSELDKINLSLQSKKNIYNLCKDMTENLVFLAFKKGIFLEPHGQNLLFIVNKNTIEGLLYKDFDSCSLKNSFNHLSHSEQILFLRRFHLMIDTYFFGGFIHPLKKVTGFDLEFKITKEIISVLLKQKILDRKPHTSLTFDEIFCLIVEKFNLN